MLWAGVGGALSGAAMGGPVSAANYVAQRGQTTDTPKSELVSGETDAGAETVPPTTAPVQEGRSQVTDGIATPPPQPAEAQKNASTGETEYRATKPQNVELPTVPIISVSMDDVAVLNGGTMPEKGNYVRKAAFDDAVRRLGLDQNEADYIEANNITRNGDAYVLKITKTALNKMLSASSYEDGTVPLETIAILKQIERVAQNGVWYESEGDRNGRDQIAGYDRLKTTVYIDNVPYAVDIRVRVEDQSVGGENRLYYFTPDSIRITKETDTGLRRARFHKRTMEGASVSNPTLSQTPSGVNPQSAPMEAEHEQTQGGVSAYGSETGDGVRDGGGGRLYGTSAGEQGGGLEQGAGQRQAAADQQRKAVERQNRVRASGAPISTASLGVRSGSEAQTVRVIEEGLWDEEMRSTAQRVQQETGQRVRFVSGPLTLQTGVGERRVRGVWTDGGDILIQADHLRLSIDQIADHEMFHAKSQKEPKLIRLAREAVCAKYGEEELTRAVERYILNLEGVIDVPEEAGGDVWSNAYLDIMEELLADAYAGIDAWGTHADRFQDVVQQTVGEAGTGRSGETAVDTERTTGPPQQRFSIETGEDGIPYVNVNLDQRLFDDLTTSEMQNVAKKIISERFKGKVIGKNYTAYVNKQSAEHYAYPANRRMDEGQKRDKMRASTELDHLIEVSRYRGNEPDDGRHPDATGGLDKLDVRLAVNGRMYDAEITVLVTDHGRIFYDLTKMKDITRREIGQTQRAAETPRDVLADSSISQPEAKRNTKFSVDDDGEQPQFRRVETLPADRWVGDFVLGAKVSANGLGIPRGTEDRILQVVTGGESGEVRRAKIAAGEAVLGILASNAWAAGISFLVALAKHKEGRYRDDEDELTAGSVLTELAQTVATYFFEVPVNNVEAYLLGLVSWASPELKTRYDDMWATVDKSGLSGLEGEALTARMESLLDKRVGGADPETAAELAALYEAGHKKAAPSDVPDSISVEGEQYKLDGYQKQLYQRVWAYINRLPISDRQKDALHYAAGYTESSLGKTPRHYRKDTCASIKNHEGDQAPVCLRRLRQRMTLRLELS